MSTNQSTTPTLPLPLPDALNPDALDVLSELAHILTRLRTLPTTTSSTTTPTPTATKKTGELTLKEIPVATDALKHRFQRARNLIKTTLPDLDRGIPAQESEIKALEARIARQRDTLAKLREVGARLAVVQGEGEVEKMEE
ncbi:hypothetical protein HD806DRAFT_533155 [Xylariaceae sp. AK1471]|nr:hypothetical protein HD806DRAFT_533155 [Xylariaceae sp. AK1471]